MFKLADEAESEMVVFIKESLFNTRVVKAFDREKYIIEKFEEKNSMFFSMQNKLMTTFAKFRSINDFLTFIQVAIIIVVGGFATIKGRMNFGDLIAFIIYINMIIWPIRQIGQLLSDMAKAKVSIFRIFEILDLPEEDYNFGIKDVNFDKSIEFIDVCLEINGNKILNNISFELEFGKSLGIIGSTASGKSMIVYLLLGFLKPTSGKILIDGISIESINKKILRENISAILQESELFNVSILENIRITNSLLDEKTVHEHANIAYIHDEISSFMSGYNTIVVDNGMNLSGGQKQRISIARGIIKPFKILILDDSMSAVDMNTDMKINNSIKNINKTFSLITISHRISTISNCDYIIVLDSGCIVEKGTHSELLDSGGIYCKINEIQSKEIENYNEQ